jgi:GNAT superfamily N-acetyltransferase
MPTPVIRMADAADGAALAALRREWTEEDAGHVADDGFEGRFLEWYEQESASRLTWLAQIEGKAVGMMNLRVFERMPRPGVDTGRWGYVGNAFVLAEHRDQGIGSLLLAELLTHADSHGFVRVVLRPTQRAIPFYERAGFGANGDLLVRPGAG